MPSTPTSGKPNSQSILLGLLVLVGLAFAGYQTLYSSFARYDDEGYVMISLQSYFNGHALYDETYTQYGPAYFQVTSLLHQTLGLPITHDLVRIKTLIAWLLAAAMAGFFVFRVAKNQLVGIAAIPLVFFHLDRIGLEAAHPQELCMLLTFGCLVLATFFDSSRVNRFVLIGAIGILVGLLLMVKLNLGIFLILGFSLAFVFQTESSKSRSVLLAGAAGLTLLMPLVVMRKHLGNFEGMQLPLLIIGSVSIAAWVSRRLDPKKNASFKSTLTSISTLATVILVVASVVAVNAWQHGTSVAGLLDGLVLQHASLDICKYVDFLWLPLPLTLASAFCAYMVVVRKHVKTQKWIDLGVLTLIGGLLFRQLTESFVPVLHGGNDRSLGSILCGAATPFVWVILIPILSGAKNVDSKMKFSRIALCFIAAIQPMQAFPIPGTQVGLGSVTLTIILLIVLVDLLERGLAFQIDPEVSQEKAALAVVVACLAIMVVRDYNSWSRRSGFVSLNLPGANRLKLPADDVEQFQWVVQELKANGDTFIAAANGYPSFYFWTELSPPTNLNATFWPTLLNKDQQLLVQSELEQREHACLLVNTETKWVNLKTPLVKYLSDNFEPIHTRNQHEIWLKRRQDSDGEVVSRRP